MSLKRDFFCCLYICLFFAQAMTFCGCSGATTSPSALTNTSTKISALPEPSMSYMAVFMSGKKVGYGSEQLTINDAGLIKSTVEMNLTISRFNLDMELKTIAESTEHTDGSPVSFSEKATMGAFTLVNNSFEFTEDKVIVTATNALGQKNISSYDRPTDLIQTPHAMKLFIKKLLTGNSKTNQFQRIEQSTKQVAKARIEILEREKISLVGQQKELTKCRVIQNNSFGEMVSYQWLDDEGNALKYEIMLDKIRLSVIACDKQYALSESGSWNVDDLAVSSPVTIDQPHKAKSVKFIITRNKEMQFPDTGEQTVLNTTDTNSMIIQTINLPDKSIPLAQTYKEPDIIKYLAPSEYIESDSPEIIALAKKITEGCESANDAACNIAQWVSDNISPAMNVPYSSALETLKNKKGDCTEHAVLTAALCRAAGLPCRILNGIAYAGEYQGLKDKFIGHAWNQVYIGDKWICMDTAYGVSAVRLAQVIGNGNPGEMIELINNGSVIINFIKPEYNKEANKDTK